MMTKNCIVVTGFERVEAPLVAEHLAERGFSVEYHRLDDLPSDAAAGAGCVLLYMAGSGQYNSRTWEKLATLTEAVPVAVLLSDSSTESYMTLLERGYFNIISVPCSIHHLISRLQGMTGIRGKTAGAKVHCSVDYEQSGKRYHIPYTPETLADFTISSIGSIIHKNELLMKTPFSGKDVILPDALYNGGHDAGDPEGVLYNELKSALLNGEFRLFYQPIVSLTTGKIGGFEALIRWQHPVRGLIRPGEFIKFLEHSHMIIPVGFWIIEEAARQLREWHERFPAEQPLTVSVNVSTRQFMNHQLSERIIEIVDSYGVDHSALRLEITESVLMEDMESANLMLLKLKAGNFTVCMDDFGTGYSSLAYLQHFPVDVLKIDQSFVRYMHIDDNSEIIVKTIVGLAHNLNMQVIGEGVESAEHCMKLREFGSDYGQGYYFSRPVSPGDAEKLLESGSAW